jgi:hypothetical protein
MRNRGWFPWVLGLGLLLAGVIPARTAEMTKLTVSVKTDSGRPIDRADVIVRFVQGRNYLKLGKKVRTTYELRTNEEGTATIPEIPQGTVRIQVIAKGYQTFGKDIDLDEAQKTVEINLLPPQPQYSAHEK